MAYYSSSRVNRHGARGRTAVESDRVNTDGASGLSTTFAASVATAGINNSDILSTTTLSVLDSCSSGAAGRALLAGGSIGHAIVEL